VVVGGGRLSAVLLPGSVARSADRCAARTLGESRPARGGADATSVNSYRTWREFLISDSPALIRSGRRDVKHDDIWRALDTLAAENGLSPSGLAKASGLDATTFNPSKRRSSDGRSRWPSTESLAKVLEATGATLEDFTALVSGARALPSARSVQRRIPLIGLAQAGGAGFFDDGGYPVGGAWDEVDLPEVGDPHAYALEISGASMEPVFRDGDVVIVSPAAPARRGDRVVVRTQEGEVMAKQLARRSARRIELNSLNPEHPDRSFELSQIAWLHRIIWASQ
jgi:phage repressor protein C with HTH and peptisase S24 domain